MMSVICYHMLKKLYMKEQRETFWRIFYTGCSLNRKLSHDMNRKRQCLFSCDMWKNTSGFWMENSSFDDWFSVYLFHGKNNSFCYFYFIDLLWAYQWSCCHPDATAKKRCSVYFTPLSSATLKKNTFNWCTESLCIQQGQVHNISITHSSSIWQLLLKPQIL